MTDDDLQVFVSSKMRNRTLKAERTAVVAVVDSLPGFRAWHWEKSAQAGPNTPLRVCLEAVVASDALILLVGSDLTEPTKREHKLAVRLKKPDFIFIKDGRRDKATKTYLKRHEKRAVYRRFRSVAELRTLVAGGLQGEMRRRWRDITRIQLGSVLPYAKSGGCDSDG